MAKRKIEALEPKKETIVKEQISDFNGYLLDNQRRVGMKVKGLNCNFHLPKALERKFDGNGNEIAQQLPPGAPRAAFAVDEYPACPESWMHGSSTASSYFVPIKPDHGIWLDMVENEQHTHHVAAVISVQGINPLTGKKSDPIRLEQYKTKCPVHDVEFKQDLFCEKCKHKWPPQNYISTNNGGKFWLDGFMAEDGVVRQWIFTEEEAKGIAAQMIKQERVFAIGIAFYLSKQPKPVAPRNVTRGVNYTCDKIEWASPASLAAKYPGIYSSDAAGIAKGGTCSHSTKISAIPDWSVTDTTTISNTASDGGSTTCSVNSVSPFLGIAVDGGPQGPTGPAGSPGPVGPSGKTLEKEEKTSGGIPRPVKKLSGAPAGARCKTRGGPSGQSLGGRGDYEVPEVRGRVVASSQDIMDRYADFETLAYVDAEEITPIRESEVKKLEVGAGAKIDQKIFADPQNLDFWEQEPAGFIYINYCDEETAKKIIAAGKREESTEGFLDGLTLAK